uniref:Rab-GAP TBC domain-containing protein n=1 Tax=Phytophthora ramorum TaxID=164328 RepID=H3HC63_PHYRM
MQLEEELLATGVTLSPTRNVSKDGDIVRRWMEMVLGDKFLGDLPAALRSGELLCDLVNKLYKALGMKSQISPVRRAEEQDSDVDALSNVLEYLRACEVLGVARQDLFQPEDLLRRKDMEKVYSNVLALQAVAVSLSSRRSIDERSSMINAPHGVFVDDDDLDEDELDLESPEAVHLLQQSRWQRLLFEYEHQQQRKEENDRAGDSSASDGLGPLAHGIWRTEERIRAILMRDDRDFGPVPEELHGKLWMLASGAQLEMRKHMGQYERLLASELESTEATRQIDVDLHRTVADEDKEFWTEEKSRMMRRILVAYSLYNPGLGYCQGLNYIVARSLHYLGEEEAFYLLIAIIRLVPDDYYTTMVSGDAFVLFRVALALLQQAKTELIACTTYGDMLKHLNELGRGDIASGIVASTVESEDRRSSTTGRRSSESRTEPRLRIFGRKNKQSIFRHIDKIPPRLARTFDRNLTDEYIQRDNNNFAEYYEGTHPQIKEEYWGSADSYRQWGARNHPFKRDYDGIVHKPDFDDVRKLARSGSGRTSPSFTQDPQDETNSNHSQDDKNGKLGTPEQTSTVPLLEKPPAHELLYSPVHYRSSSMDFAADEPSSCAPPLIRRIVSVPAEEVYAQQKRLRNSKRSNECSQAIRERANVLQYMQRKASDASSIASSIPRSPHERVDMAARMSESSSDSSRFGEHASNRSGKSMPFRKSSFSFFDKLSSDLESSDDAEFKTESIGRGSMSSVTTGRSSTVDEQRPMGGAISISS